jgi:DUF4097 and DUF4098 domain-containing protein YvlB
MSLNTEPRSARVDDTGITPPPTVPNEPYYRRGEQARRWGALLLLIGVVWLVFTITSRGSFFGMGFIERTAELPAQSYAVERVVISGVNDNVELVAWNGDEVRVTGVKHAFGWNVGAAEDALEGLQLAVDESGDTLTIDVQRPGFFGIGRSPYVNLEISLPAEILAEASIVSGDLSVEGVRGDLTLRSVSGTITAEDTAGLLSVSTTSGDVALEGHTGGLAVETVSGDVRAEGDLENPQVESVSGDVELEGVSGSVDMRSISGELGAHDAGEASLMIESTSGDVEFSGALASGTSNRIGNISGDVHVRLADAADLQLELTSTSGDLDTDLDLSRLERERRRISGASGSGATSLSISTTSGDVEVTGD